MRACSGVNAGRSISPTFGMSTLVRGFEVIISALTAALNIVFNADCAPFTVLGESAALSCTTSKTVSNGTPSRVVMRSPVSRRMPLPVTTRDICEWKQSPSTNER
jgi:hypothetical protein